MDNSTVVCYGGIIAPYSIFWSMGICKDHCKIATVEELIQYRKDHYAR